MGSASPGKSGLAATALGVTAWPYGREHGLKLQVARNNQSGEQYSFVLYHYEMSTMSPSSEKWPVPHQQKPALCCVRSSECKYKA